MRKEQARVKSRFDPFIVHQGEISDLSGGIETKKIPHIRDLGSNRGMIDEEKLQGCFLKGPDSG